LTSVEAARLVLAGTRSVLLARADEIEALLRLSLGDLRSPAGLAGGLPATPRGLLLARIALASGDHHRALGKLTALPQGDLTPRAALVREILLAAAAIQRGDPAARGIVGGMVEAARHGRFLNTVVMTAPSVTAYLVEHSADVRPEPFVERLIVAALEVRAVQPGTSHSRGVPAGTLTASELRILKLLPTSTYLQIAATLFVSRNTVKAHLRSVYQKLGVSSRAEAIERAVDLRLL
jgi:LuxR family maltose regulon positive regulatory protein